MINIAFGWVAFAAITLIVIALCVFITKYYSDRHESEFLPTLVTVVSLSVTLFCVFLIPVDILNSSTTSNPDGTKTMSFDDIEARSANVRNLYYFLYAASLVLAVVVIPFTYFYYEEYDEEVTVGKRIFGGCKYTAFLIVLVIIVFVVGLFVTPTTLPQINDAQGWVDYLSDSNNGGERSISFAIACLTLVGYFSWLTYTAYGLSAFPVGLLKGKRHVTEEASDLHADLEATREQTRAISSRYMTGKKMSERDEKQLDLLKRQERVLSKRNVRLVNTRKGGLSVITNACKPFAFVFGIFCVLVTLLIWISVLLTLVDKFQNSCGAACGFIQKYPEIKSPIDLVLTGLAPYFPLDYIAIGSVIFYVFFCTLSGVVRIGIRFLWIHMYDIKPRQTAPQGLLVGTVILMLALLALNMNILILAPKYATYGSQVYISGNETLPCSITAPQNGTFNSTNNSWCTMTQIGVIASRIQLGTPFFGNVYYYATWVFILTFLIGAIVALVKRKASNIGDDENDSDEDEGVGSIRR